MPNEAVSDYSVGDTLEPLIVEDIDRLDFVKYAGASGDFNPIHVVEPYAQEAGNPSVFGHGMLTAGFVASFVSDRFGLENVARLRTRFQSRLWPGDTVTVTGEITDESTDGDRTTYEVELIAENQKGETLISGDATVRP